MAQTYPLDLNTEFSPSAQGSSFLGHNSERPLAKWERKYLRMNGLNDHQEAHLAARIKPVSKGLHFEG